MKKVCAFLLILITAFSLSACGDGSRDPDIKYSIGYGTKIEELSSAEQKKIAAYVSDCKLLYTVGFANYHYDTFDGTGEPPYLSFTDTFVYDFSKVDEDSLDVASKKNWDMLKSQSKGESRPLMYVELSGYAQAFPGYTLTPIIGGGIYFGYLIFEDESVCPFLYRNVANTTYYFTLVSGTEIINCGDAYAEEKTWEEATELYEAAMEDGGNPAGLLEKLRLLGW